MKISIIFILIICMISFVYADSTYILNTPINLVQTCNNCTYCNVSSVLYPNSSYMLNDQVMTKHNYEFDLTINASLINVVGTYQWFYICGNSVTGDTATGMIIFPVNGIGYNITTGQAIIMIIAFLSILLLSWSFFFFASIIEYFPAKLFLYVMSAIIEIFSVGYGYFNLSTLNGEFSSIPNIYGQLFTILVYLTMAGGFGLMMWLVYFAFDTIQKRKGLRI